MIANLLLVGSIGAVIGISNEWSFFRHHTRVSRATLGALAAMLVFTAITTLFGVSPAGTENLSVAAHGR